MPDTNGYSYAFDPNKTDEAMETIADIYGYNKKDEKKENIFLDTFKEKLQENLKDGFLSKSKEESRKYDIYGDRRRSSGDTVADLGGGNTAITPDTQSLINTQLAAAQMANQPSQGRMAGQALGGSIGGALGTSMIAKAGGAAAAGLGTTIGAAALGPLGMLAGGALGGLFG